MTQALILAGGAGTRLASVTGDLPKTLVDIDGVPLLGRQLTMLAEQGFCDVVVFSGHRATTEAASRADRIASYCGDGSRWGLSLRCAEEPEPRGTAGAVLHVIGSLQAEFLVLYGDTVMDVDLRRMVDAHRASQAAATLFVHPNDHPHDSDLVEVDANGHVVAFHPNPHAADAELPNLVNAALYVIDRDALRGLDGLPAKSDFGHHVFPLMLRTHLKVQGYKSPEYIKDAGTPGRVAKVVRDIRSGKVGDRSFRAPAPAVFIDRDGVINVERGLITKSGDLDLIDGVAAAIGRLNDSRYRAICITNQPVIARGDVSVEGLARIHARLDTLLGREGAFLDDLYFCPHHPDGGFAGERPELKFACACRKPETGLIECAVADYNIDLSRSWMIGDRTADIELARRAGLRSVLVATGHAGGDGQYDATPDHRADDLAHAVDLIARETPDDFYVHVETQGEPA